MQFAKVKEFLEEWGLSFDTPDGVSSDIPYPSIYNKMQGEAKKIDPSGKLSKFISSNTDTTDGCTYLCANSWEELEKKWSPPAMLDFEVINAILSLVKNSHPGDFDTDNQGQLVVYTGIYLHSDGRYFDYEESEKKDE